MAGPLMRAEIVDNEGATALLFSLHLMGARFAFEALLVMEVVRLGPLTRLPAAPSFLPGVFAYRGEVLAVLDVAQLVGRPPIPIRASTRAVVVQSGPSKVAVIADGVGGLVEIPRNQLEPPPSEGSGIAEFLSAMGRDDRGTFTVIDLPRLVETARARSIPA